MTTEPPRDPNSTEPPTPADAVRVDPRAGCLWGWWLLLVIALVCFIWWAGWGWGTSGGYWFRTHHGGNDGAGQKEPADRSPSNLQPPSASGASPGSFPNSTSPTSAPG